MFRKSLILYVVAGLLASFSLLAAAFFTAQATVTDNQFTTGTLDLAISPATSAITFSQLVPTGHDKARRAELVVTNSGSLPLRYAMQTTATNPDGKGLADRLSLEIGAPSHACEAENVYFDATIYFGPLGNGAIGDPAPGAQAGDRVLAPGANEKLCFLVSLPANTGNEYQGATTTTTLTFTAEQIANNP